MERLAMNTDWDRDKRTSNLRLHPGVYQVSFAAEKPQTLYRRFRGKFVSSTLLKLQPDSSIYYLEFSWKEAAVRVTFRSGSKEA